MRKLSECRFDCKYAYCDKCKEIFIDDMLNYGSLYCPNGCGYALDRSIILRDKKFFRGVVSLQKGVLEWEEIGKL